MKTGSTLLKSFNGLSETSFSEHIVGMHPDKSRYLYMKLTEDGVLQKNDTLCQEKLIEFLNNDGEFVKKNNVKRQPEY